MNFKQKPIFGMIHLSGNVGPNIMERAMQEVEILIQEGVDGCIIENYHGEVADMSTVLNILNQEKAREKIMVGLNILPNDYEKVFEMAKVYNAQFVQIDYVAGAYKNGNPIDVEKYLSNKATCPDVTVLGGVWPKYYRPVPNSVLKNDIENGMKLAEAIVVTGEGTGKQTPFEKITEFRNILGEHPLIVGAGLNISNVVEQLSVADGGIVGSCFKPHGITTKKIERSLVQEFMSEVKKARMVSAS